MPDKIGYTAVEVDGVATFPSLCDINKYFLNGGLDYSHCQFECRLVKQKKLINDKVKYAYMLNEFFIICNVKTKEIVCEPTTNSLYIIIMSVILFVIQEPYKKIPDKIIELKPNNRVVWDYNRTKVPYRLIGFHLLDGKDVFEY